MKNWDFQFYPLFSFSKPIYAGESEEMILKDNPPPIQV